MAALLLVGALASCNKQAEIETPAQEPQTQEVQEEKQEIKFNISVADVNPETKALKSGWEEGDKLNIWFNFNTQKEPDLIMTYVKDGENYKWELGELRNGVEFDDTGDICICIYEGFNSLNEAGGYTFDEYINQENESDYYFSRTTELNGDSCPQFRMTLFGSSDYSYDNNTVSTTLGDDGWEYYTGVQIVITGLDNTKPGEYTLSSTQIKSLKSFNTYDANFEDGLAVAGVSNTDGVAFYFFEPDVASDGVEYTFVLSDYTTDKSNPAVKSYTVKGTIATGQTTTNGPKKCVGIKIPESKFAVPAATTGTAKAKLDGTNEVDVTWVQLWENGPKWATINVGVTSTSATGADLYGGYYRWGGTTSKSTTDVYIGTDYDGNGNLKSDYDTATKLWGSNWRMPTKDELTKLKDDCTWSTFSSGYTITGKGDYASNSIFLPAAGYIESAGSTVYNAGNYGHYWSSTPSISYSAYEMYFNSGEQIMYSENREYGDSVRAVLAE